MKSKFILILFCLVSLHCVSAAPTDEQYQGVLNLVKAGKIVEAKVKVETYLEIWPEEAQLLAIAESLKGYVEAQPAAALKSLNSTNAESQQIKTSDQTVLSDSSRAEIDKVLELLKSVVEAKDFEARYDAAYLIWKREIPAEAMDAATPSWIIYWTARAAAAVTLEDHKQGWQAARKLIELGATDVENDAVEEVLKQLRIKDWLNPNREEVYEAGKANRRAKFAGRWFAEVSLPWRAYKGGDYLYGKYSAMKVLEITFPKGHSGAKVEYKESDISVSHAGSDRSVWTSGLSIPGQDRSSGKAPLQTEWIGSGAYYDDTDPRLLVLKFTKNGRPFRMRFLLSADEKSLYCVNMISDIDGRKMLTYEDFRHLAGTTYVKKHNGTFETPFIVKLERQ